MTTQIKITAPYGTKIVSLNEIREMILDRRVAALRPNGRKTEYTVHTRKMDSLQPAAHYCSFEIKAFNHDQAIKVFNAGGCQKAELI